MRRPRRPTDLVYTVNKHELLIELDSIERAIARSRTFHLGANEAGRTPAAPTLDQVVLSHRRWTFVWQRSQHLVSRFARRREQHGAQTFRGGAYGHGYGGVPDANALLRRYADPVDALLTDRREPKLPPDLPSAVSRRTAASVPADAIGAFDFGTTRPPWTAGSSWILRSPPGVGHPRSAREAPLTGGCLSYRIGLPPVTATRAPET